MNSVTQILIRYSNYDNAEKFFGSQIRFTDGKADCVSDWMVCCYAAWLLDTPDLVVSHDKRISNNNTLIGTLSEFERLVSDLEIDVGERPIAVYPIPNLGSVLGAKH
jgi:hypothetical protein